MNAHLWRPSVRKGTPVLRCANGGCPLVWWPDRGEPKKPCEGTPVSEAVRALIVGGAA